MVGGHTLPSSLAGSVTDLVRVTGLTVLFGTVSSGLQRIPSPIGDNSGALIILSEIEFVT